MVSRTVGLTEDDRQRLHELKTQHQQKAGQITDCTHIRDAFNRGNTIPYLANTNDVTPEAIRRHLAGRCACDATTPPLEASGGGKHNRWMECPREGCTRAWKRYQDVSEHIQHDHEGVE